MEEHAATCSNIYVNYFLSYRSWTPPLFPFPTWKSAFVWVRMVLWLFHHLLRHLFWIGKPEDKHVWPPEGSFGKMLRRQCRCPSKFLLNPHQSTLSFQPHALSILKAFLHKSIRKPHRLFCNRKTEQGWLCSSSSAYLCFLCCLMQEISEVKWNCKSYLDHPNV